MNISEIMGHYCAIGILDALIEIVWVFPAWFILWFIIGILVARIWWNK